VAAGALAAAALVAVALLQRYAEHLAWQLHEHTGQCSVLDVVRPPESPDEPFPRYDRYLSASAAAAPDFAGERRVDFVWVTAAPDLCWVSVQSVCAAFGGAGTLHVIVPDDMLETLTRDARSGRYTCPDAARAAALPVRLHAESILVPGFAAGAVAPERLPGTLRQMALKLAAASAAGVVETEFFVVMDSDVFARRPFGVSDLLVEDSVDVAAGTSSTAGGPPPTRRQRVRRQRARTDFDFSRGKQPLAWHVEAARALRSRIVQSTNEACASLWPGSEPIFAAGRDAPFALRRTDAGHSVYSACQNGAGMTTHVTPMVMSREIVRRVLMTRLEALHAAGAAAALAGPLLLTAVPSGAAVLSSPSLSSSSSSSSAAAMAAAPVAAAAAAAAAPASSGQASLTGALWLDVLVAFHEDAARRCASFAGSAGRFYSWTEYSLYFVAGVASGALDDFHAFDFGWLASFRRSVFDHADYRAADWDAIFEDAADPALLVIVQGWMGLPFMPLFGALARHAANLSAAFPNLGT